MVLIQILKRCDEFISARLFGTTIGTYPILRGFSGRRRLLTNGNKNARKLHDEHILPVESIDKSEYRLAQQASIMLDQLENQPDDNDKLDLLKRPFTLKLANFHRNDPTFAETLEELCSKIQLVLGLPVEIVSTLVWRNYHTDDASLFSGDWHFDRRPTNWFRLFIIASKQVDENDGPFTYLSRENSKQIIKSGFRRKMKKVNDFDGIKSNILTGKRGKSIIIDTQYLLHRAGNPDLGKNRDMIEIVFTV